MFKQSLLPLALALLAGCSSRGGSPENPIFPEPYTTTQDQGRGTYPTLAAVQNLPKGLTKDQLYERFGRPHYDEGFFGVRQWDYLFHFNEGSASTCQLKVFFDDDLRSSSYHWRAVEPANAACPPPVREASSSVALKRTRLSADALFDFDRAELSANGRATLTNFSQKLSQAGQPDRINIIGHTDRLGTDDYNQRLSEARANSVKNFLVAQGISPNLISASGKGEAEPVVRPQLIKCLQPNRRVDIDVISED